MKMHIVDLPHWQRQKLVLIERIHNDLARHTEPIFHILMFAAVIYLPCFALVMVGGTVPVGALAALLVISTAVLLNALLAFALAITIDAYFRSRIAILSRPALHGTT